VQALIAGLPTSFSDPRQQVVYELLNRRIEKYSSIIRDVALNERVGYVPVYAESSANIHHPNPSKKLQDDVHFRKSRSST
jgi:hypothetical protein